MATCHASRDDGFPPISPGRIIPAQTDHFQGQGGVISIETHGLVGGFFVTLTGIFL